MKYSWAATGFLVLAISTRANAAEPPQKKLELSVSGGYSATDQVLDVTHAIPIGVSAGYRFTPSWSAGVYGEYGIIHGSFVNPDLDGTRSGSHLRLGIQVRHQVAPEKIVNPWLGVGIGLDRISYDESDNAGFPTPEHYSFNVRTTGIELLSAQFGIEFHVVPAFGIGPYVNGTVVDYLTIKPVDDSRDPPGLQMWLTLGARATLYL